MLISEVVSSGMAGPEDELVVAIEDLLSRYMADSNDEADIPTDEFKSNLEADINRPIDMGTLISVLGKSGFASSVDKTTIRAKGDLSKDIDTDPEKTVDVGKMAGDQAMKDIKADL